MGFIRKIIRTFRLFLLRRALKSLKRRRRVIGYEKARLLALLYNTPEDDQPAFLNRLVNQLQTEGKTVDAVGFFNNRIIPENVNPSPPVRLCHKNDFAWTMRPKTAFLKDFVAREYDILIDLSSSEAYQMKYLAALSPAMYKVGANHPDFIDIYDLIINVNEQCKADELAKHVIHYLKVIKTPVEPNHGC